MQDAVQVLTDEVVEEEPDEDELEEEEVVVEEPDEDELDDDDETQGGSCVQFCPAQQIKLLPKQA